MASFRPDRLKSEELRCELAIAAGLSGLAYGWRKLGWKNVSLLFQIETTDCHFTWCSERGVALGEQHTSLPALVFRDIGSFLSFIEYGKLTFFPKFGLWNCISLARFLLGAARLELLMRGKSYKQLGSKQWLSLHGEVSLYTAILGIIRLVKLEPRWAREFANYPAKRIGFFLGENSKPLAGMAINDSGDVAVLEHSSLQANVCSVVLVFRDEASLYTAVHHKVSSLEQIGDGRLKVSGLIPLADSVSAALDEVDRLLNPQEMRSPTDTRLD